MEQTKVENTCFTSKALRGVSNELSDKRHKSLLNKSTVLKGCQEITTSMTRRHFQRLRFSEIFLFLFKNAYKASVIAILIRTGRLCFASFTSFRKPWDLSDCKQKIKNDFLAISFVNKQTLRRISKVIVNYILIHILPSK